MHSHKPLLHEMPFYWASRDFMKICHLKMTPTCLFCSFFEVTFLTALAGQSSQGRTPTRPRDKRDKMAILLWNSTEKGQFVPGTGPILSRGGVPFVPGTVPVCPRHRPAENVYVYWFFSCPFLGF